MRGGMTPRRPRHPARNRECGRKVLTRVEPFDTINATARQRLRGLHPHGATQVDARSESDMVWRAVPSLLVGPAAVAVLTRTGVTAAAVDAFMPAVGAPGLARGHLRGD